MRSRRSLRPVSSWIGLSVCFALITTSLAIAPLNDIQKTALAQSDESNGKARKVKPQPPEKGAPTGLNLPNLDEVKRQPQVQPEAQSPISSSVRSKRKPLRPWHGKKVGDPGTTGIGANTYPPSRTDRTVALHHRSKTASLSRRAATMTPTPVADDGFVTNFLNVALPSLYQSGDITYWTDILRSAQPSGTNVKLIAARELGNTIFGSAKYIGRPYRDCGNSTNSHNYVSDLYWTYLMRAPDQAGWDFWATQCQLYGRDAVRAGFDQSGEFIDLIASLYANGSISSNLGSISGARVDPFNQTGDQLAARDCEWSLPLISLPGRAGLDLGLGLSYSSLVYTRSGPYLYFDEDSSSISPGFRLGFASIQGPSFDALVGKKVYMLVSSSGRRVELRQVGTTEVYEAGDSSYIQLTNNTSWLLLRTTDGTQISYSSYANGWQATEIKDRNGNKISITNDWRGDIQNITDTLNRTIYFNPDSNGNLLSITQIWNGVWHTWATFGWGAALTMNVDSFSGVAVVGTYTGEAIPVLRQVSLDDGSYYTFEYAAAGQVNLIRRYTSDAVSRSSIAYDYDNSTSDCPRTTQSRVQAENWTGVNGVPYEVTTQFTLPGDGSHQMTVLSDPNSTLYRDYYGSGWQKGLVTQSEVWAGGVKQKWTTIARTQDNISVNYQMNPRVTEINIYDVSGNRRRTTIDYGPPQYAQYGLPYAVSEYASDGTTEIRRTYTDYNLSQQYLDRRIIGLVAAVHVLDCVSWQWKVKTLYGYDAPTALDPQATTATMHDQSYDVNNTTRGNLTSVARWDVTDMENAAKALTTQIRYHAAGAVISATDPAGHTNTISYTDSFSDSINHNTFAYPTTLTDSDGFQSFVQYNYDFGARTRMQAPPPAGQSQGAIQTITYDSARRVDRVTTTNTGGYVRYVYGPNYTQTWSTVNVVADEAYSIKEFDGAGHTIFVAGYHPGSAGGYWGQVTRYDQLARVVQQTNPTEMNGFNTPTGDDAAGWQYNVANTFDWKSRPLRTYNMDGTFKEASYAGCGCAGGEVVTLTDEVGRQQKVYSDVLGRSLKTEVLNWNGTVYSATVNTFNARDQVTLVRQWAGPENGGTYQDTTMSYDGYGRLSAKHVPEQNAGTNTVYVYNNDDTIYSVTDARGAVATYSYNSRHLVTGISYSAPAGITAASNVSFTYDCAGNRSSMTDGVGSVTYSYNQLSQMTSETRTITGLGNYTIGYDYDLAGQLKSITDPAGAIINYGHDGMGRLNGVSGSSFGGVTTYASNLQYRAWGSMKHLTYGNSKYFDTTYNSRLQPSSFSVPGVISKTYDYYADGRLRFSSDSLNHKYDRSYIYDRAARMTQALSGAEARNEGTTNDRLYNETFTYDALSHLTHRESKVWTWQSSYSIPETYTNNRSSAADYDADGNQTANSDATYTLDAAGNIVTVATSDPQSTTTRTLDGLGQQMKALNATYNETTQSWTNTTTYYIHSTMLSGQVLTELNESGSKHKTYIYTGSQVFATQEIIPYYNSQSVTWEHRDPSNASYRTSYATGDISDYRELDPTNADTISDPNGLIAYPPDDGTGSLLQYPSFSSPRMQGTTFRVNNIPVSLDDFMPLLDFAYHGDTEFALVESSARASRIRLRNYTVDYGEGPPQDFGLDWESALALHMHARDTILWKNWIVNDSWGGEWSFFASALSEPQKPIPAPGEQHKMMLNVAFGDASSAIAPWKRGKNPCLAFFTQGRSLEEVSKIFSNFWSTAQMNPSAASSIAGTVNSGQGMNARVTFYAPFFANTGETEAGMLAGYNWEPARGRYEELFTSLTPRQYRALTVLHELAHALGLIPSDKNDKRATGSQSQRNDQIIDDKCGKFLASLPAQ